MTFKYTNFIYNVKRTKVKFISLMILLFIDLLSINAQELRRKGLLGIRMQTVTDSIMEQYQLNENSGLFLSFVMPNSTFHNLGAQNGDVLTMLNGQEVNVIQDVLNITSRLRAGDKIVAKYLRNGVEKEEKTKILAKPYESFQNAEISYKTVSYTGNQLRSILVTPKEVVNPPVVFFLQGYTCGSVETVGDANPMKRLMQDWIDAGFAVFRVEKPGVGDSESKKHCSQISFEEELKAFKEGYKFLLALKEIDTNNVFMFGHSMGGVIAPLLDKIKSPRGILVYGTVGENWYDYMNDLYTIQPKHFGVSESQIKEDNKVNLPFNEDFLIRKKTADELSENKQYIEFFRHGEMDFENSMYIGRHFNFWQNLADINIPKAWASVKTNVLALYGEFDIQAINKQGTIKIKEIVNKNGGKADFKLIANADHGFVNFNSMQHNINTLNNGTYLNHARDNYSTLLGEETTKWMLNKITKD